MKVYFRSIIMALTIVLSNLVGIILKEWKGVDFKTMIILLIGIVVLVLSTFVVEIGN